MVQTHSVPLYPHSRAIYRVDSVAIDVLDRGSPFTFVLVHGHCSNKHAIFFDAIFERSPHNVVRFDSPGQGDAPGTYSLSYADEVDVLSSVLDHLKEYIQEWGLSRTVLVGHSRGANISLLYIQRLVLQCPEQPELPYVVVVSGRFDLSGTLTSQLTPEEVLQLENGHEFTKAFPGCRCPLLVTPAFILERRSIQLGDACRVLSQTDRLAVLHGTNDRAVPPQESSLMVQFYSEEKKRSRLRLVDEATHNWKYKLEEGYHAFCGLIEGLLVAHRKD
ncbi:Alpha/beta hydrolase family protein [Giardia duodenalis]|uniref:Alpha/beta hydrolase family protein n=1 Tax=Giardia intestinalis (strain ATCC 50803 / WB clone C6) TaxID=184922 RepID=A8B4P6_GIAIC|nr:Alpha/beta hydrolase family protein [Giardia intestinalis]KAE8303732.1 Alpha/beta hydrolase family protein [Giardia intestinalis]|eukprot:XP_001709657.1 Hypothetical protein GL50803_113970 [Giardia lamblia ATCC 50803]